MWGLVASALTIAVSVLTKKEVESKDTTSASSSKVDSGPSTKRYSLPLSNMTTENQVFFSGIVLGAGLSMLYTVVQTHFRLHDRLRLAWHNCWDKHSSILELTEPLKLLGSISRMNSDNSGSEGSDSDNNNNNKATSNDTAKGAENNNDSGNNDSHNNKINCCTLLVNSSTVASSTLHISVLKLPGGTEMQSRYASAVEFYYVLSGKGLFSQQGVHVTAHLQPGVAFVVHPGAMRWISNSRGTEDLILLRATDGGSEYNKASTNAIRFDPNQRRLSTMQQLNKGIRQVQEMAKNYVARAGSLKQS